MTPTLPHFQQPSRRVPFAAPAADWLQGGKGAEGSCDRFFGPVVLLIVFTAKGADAESIRKKENAIIGSQPVTWEVRVATGCLLGDSPDRRSASPLAFPKGLRDPLGPPSSPK